MGLFDMFKKAFGMDVDDGKEAEQIKEHIGMAFGDKIAGLNVVFDDGKVTLGGQADSYATKQKAVLMAGNVKNVEAVEDLLTVKVKEPEPELKYYTIVKGDSLSKIAKEVYGDYKKWTELFEANREVIKDPDLIYPGQTIRIPDL
jgi:nucleoid-associated protein YgaU